MLKTYKKLWYNNDVYCWPHAFIQLTGKPTTSSSCCAFCYSFVAQQHFATHKKGRDFTVLRDVQTGSKKRWLLSTNTSHLTAWWNVTIHIQPFAEHFIWHLSSLLGNMTISFVTPKSLQCWGEYSANFSHVNAALCQLCVALGYQVFVYECFHMKTFLWECVLKLILHWSSSCKYFTEQTLQVVSLFPATKNWLTNSHDLVPLRRGGSLMYVGNVEQYRV